MVPKQTYFLPNIKCAEQYSQCIWDKDTDEMIWYPDEIDECTRKYNDTIVLIDKPNNINYRPNHKY